MNARNFFNVGRLLPSRSNTYELAAEGPIIPQKLSLLLDFDQTLTSGFVNGNVQVPRDEPGAREHTPLSTSAPTNAIIADLLKAFPAELPNLPYVSKRQLNSNAQRDINGVDGLARLDWKLNDRTSAASRYFVNQYVEDPFHGIMHLTDPLA